MMQTFFKAAILDEIGLTDVFFPPVKLIKLLFFIQVKEAKCCSCAVSPEWNSLIVSEPTPTYSSIWQPWKRSIHKFFKTNKIHK